MKPVALYMASLSYSLALGGTQGDSQTLGLLRILLMSPLLVF